MEIILLIYAVLVAVLIATAFVKSYNDVKNENI